MTKQVIKLGTISIPIDDYASQGNAILGIRDSGKSYTATGIAEKLFDAGIPFTAFDPIGIWRYLRVPNSGKGLPVVVAGGKGGDLPLTPESAPEIVRAAMREGISLVLDLYDMHLSKADWKRIVQQSIRVLLYENSEYGLRHIFMEEAAEFCPQRVGPDSGAVYAEVEKLARMGGNSLLGYTLINQRSEEVNKAVLELCDTLLLHRQKGRNSLTALGKWLDFADPASSKEIIKSLPILPQGECWVWVSGSDAPVRVKVPQKRTFHPDRRMLRANLADSKSRQAVSVETFVANMSGALEAHMKEAVASDPKALRARILELEKKLAEKPAGKTTATKIKRIEVPAVGQKAIAGLKAAAKQIDRTFLKARTVADAFAEGMSDIEKNQTRIFQAIEKLSQSNSTEGQRATVIPEGIPGSRLLSAPAASPHTSGARVAGNGAGHTGLSGPEQKIVDAIAWFASIEIMDPAREAVAFLAGYTANGGAFKNPCGRLRANGMIDYRTGRRLALTDLGWKKANRQKLPLSNSEVQARAISVLPGPEAKLLSAILAAYPNALDDEGLANQTGYTAGAGAFNNPKGRLRSLGLITYPRPRHARAADILFPVQP